MPWYFFAVKYYQKGSLIACVTANCLLAEVGWYPKVLHCVMRMIIPASYEERSAAGRGIWGNISALTFRFQRSANNLGRHLDSTPQRRHLKALPVQAYGLLVSA